MATMRSKPPVPVGSAQWVLDERIQGTDFVTQEVEEFHFSVRNDMEWLNEHMADIFQRNHFDVAEAFKTPGKLRGKTPRTVRRRGLETRAPLADVFSSHNEPNPSPSRGTPSMKKIAHFQVAEDKDESHVIGSENITHHSFGHGKENFDSGYHGTTDDETVPSHASRHISPQKQGHGKQHYIHSPPKQQQTRPVELFPSKGSGPGMSDKGLVSITSDNASRGEPPQDPGSQQTEGEDATGADEGPQGEVQNAQPAAPEASKSRQSHQYSVTASTADAMDSVLTETERQSPMHHAEDTGQVSPSSEGSSEHRPALRKKSSLTFASLPAREPLATSKSIGARASRTSHLDHARVVNASQGTLYGRQTIGKTVAESQPTSQTSGVLPAQEDEELEAEKEALSISPSVSDAAKMHSKTSTQRLQERLALLGKSTAPRISKSTHPHSGTTGTTPAEEAAGSEHQVAVEATGTQPDGEDDSWISPPANHGKRPAQAEPASPDRQHEVDARDVAEDMHVSTPPQATVAAAYPQLPHPGPGPEHNENPSSTDPRTAQRNIQPVTKDFSDSPSANRHDGPLSASKAKLFSVFKSAKGMFASSASASAHAKMNTTSPRVPLSKSQTSLRSIQTNELGAAEREADHAAPLSAGTREPHRPEAANLQKDLPRSPKRTSARLKDMSKPDRADDTVNEDRAESRQEDGTQEEQHDIGLNVEDEEMTDLPPPPPPKPEPAQSQKPSELRRPGRITKEPAQKSKPAPVNIRLRGFQGHGIGNFGPSNRPASTAQSHDPAPAVPPKYSTLTKKASNSSISSSAQSFKTTATSRPKALEAAARKKEQDEREAQRKAEQKRDLERRRAAKAEEERKAEQDRRAAEQRAAEAKQLALKQAADQRKAEAIKRNEQLRNQAATAAASARNRPGDDLAHALQDERHGPLAAQQRGDLGPRSMSRMASNDEFPRPPIPHVNPAKPRKRQFDAEEDDEPAQRPQPARLATAGNQPHKRRKTSEDSFAEVISRPTMAPPVRPSMKRQEATARPVPTSFANSQSQMQGSSSMMKTALSNQYQMQHPKTPHMSELAKFSNAKIPFAENHPPGASQQQPHSQRQPTQFKTPGTANKSSPQYPNGDNISLPEIATDSEDSDDDNDFVPPDWANSPALRDLLKDQQLVDPMKVFGPIAPLMMEEVFKGNKERQAKFRKRTSSANWNGPDRLTEDERKKDREARERLERDGAWTFTTSN